ncbi:hypothetical protein GCM10010371_33530 [Streptomyces subrutilus]|uniref:Uncharacterized protein n=1 Tax=Streptomyces subrutilus TaxID=36818 RepID=A0A5P2UY53_9ACTN|nr:hypothetical protein [Streptomyces subrutilus]QEU82424.1 hypothetical protein CP968_32905 [Streptomyces subrutilus]GGZ70818.1 hypothetical protein GCM10010371_33530 [Streptomyces subrutilus]
MAGRVAGFAVSGAVLAGVPVGTYLAAWAAWEGRLGPWTAPLFLSVVLLHWVAVWWAARHDGAAVAVVVLVLNLSWMLLVHLRIDLREERAVHERGVTERAVVTQWIRTSDPFAGVRDAVTAIELALPAGGAARLELDGAGAPPVGAAVQVTRDPDGRVPIRLGGPPAAPGGGPATIALVLVLGSSLFLSARAAAAVHDALS